MILSITNAIDSELTSKDLIATAHVPIPHMMTTLVFDNKNQSTMLLTSGSPTMVSANRQTPS